MTDRSSLRTTLAGLIRGTGTAALGGALGRLGMLLGLIFAARSLGPEGMGHLGLVQATLAMAGILAGIGLGGTLSRALPRWKDTDPARASRITGLVVLVAAFGAGVLATSLVIGAPYLAAALAAETALAPAIALGAVLLLGQACRGLQDGVLVGLRAHGSMSAARATEGLAALLLLPPAAAMAGANGAVGALALAVGLAVLVGGAGWHRAMSRADLRITFRGAWEEVPILWRYALPSLGAGLAAAPALFAMTLILSHEAGLAELGLYTAAYQWHGPLVYVPALLGLVGIPAFVESGGDPVRFRRLLLWTTAGGAGAALVPALGVALLSGPIIGHYGPAFAGAAPVLAVLALAAPLHAASKLGGAALLAQDRAWAHFGLATGWACLLVALCGFLIPPFGALGAALAFLASYGGLAAASLTVALTWTIGAGRAVGAAG
ncbi:MAG: oligosaccharide flippase family protein [Pseudomonadota bacterium]